MQKISYLPTENTLKSSSKETIYSRWTWKTATT